MKDDPREKQRDRLITELSRLWKDEQDHFLLANLIRALDARYDLLEKAAKERGLIEIVTQMAGRLARAFVRLSDLEGKKVLDIACGSNTSKAPALLKIDTPFGKIEVGRSTRSYTALFEPWFCRMLLELGAQPVGVDVGDLEGEVFTHYRVDLGRKGALDFLPTHSFDALQDSRLFGSPEFTSQFPNQAERLEVACEIRRQEERLLKTDGIVIHSDAAQRLKSTARS